MLKKIRALFDRLRGKKYLPSTELHSGLPAQVEKREQKKQTSSFLQSIISKIKYFFSQS